MPNKPFDFAICTPGKAVPAGDDWLHEIKYDGFRARLERDGAGQACVKWHRALGQILANTTAERSTQARQRLR
jgi:hypothetical protein